MRSLQIQILCFLGNGGKCISLLICMFCSVTVLAQQKMPVKVFTEKEEGGKIYLFARNTAPIPYSIELKVKTKNMKLSDKFDSKQVIKPLAEKQQVQLLTPEEGTDGQGYSMSYSVVMGDVLHVHPNKKYVYSLPYRCNESYSIDQGYFGKFSHTNEAALDFSMPQGTKVLAVRDGVVAEIKKDSNKGCPKVDCKGFANYIIIYQPEDNTFAIYSHFKYKGVRVKVGQQVKQGDWIGISGNTGQSTGPHLHFEVYYYDLKSRISIPTLFQTRQKPEGVFLEEGKTYTCE